MEERIGDWLEWNETLCRIRTKAIYCARRAPAHETMELWELAISLEDAGALMCSVVEDEKVHRVLEDLRDNRRLYLSCVGDGYFDHANDGIGGPVNEIMALMADCSEENRKILLSAVQDTIRDYAEILGLLEADSEEAEQAVMCP